MVERTLLQKLIRKDRRIFFAGCVCMFFGLLAPWIIKTSYFGVLKLTHQSLITGDVTILLFAAFRLVMMNTIRALPIYMGAFLAAEGMGMFQHGRVWWLRWSVVFFIPVIYFGIYILHGVVYDFGVPAIAMSLAIIIVSQMKHLARNVFHKLAVIALLLFGVEWLDIVPVLTAYDFGGGPLSMYLKQVADVNRVSELFNIVGIVLFFVFVGNAFLLARLLNLYTLEIQSVEQAFKVAHLQHQMTIQAMENRSLRELSSLVHDLKTPLTSIQGLAGVISISDNAQLSKHHADYISSMVDKMSIMIDELLKEDSRQIMACEELVKYAVAHVPQLNKCVRFELEIVDDFYVEVNKIRIARAIINLLNNAIDAVGGKSDGLVRLAAQRSKAGVAIIVMDNGAGFWYDSEQQEIWQVGFSEKESTGLGLAFVREVVEQHHGTVLAENRLEGGAMVTITLQEVEPKFEKDKDFSN